MLDAVYEQLRDAPREFVTPEGVVSWLNEAQRDLAARLPILQKQTNVVVTGNAAPLPDDLLKLRRARHGTEDIEFELTDEDFWDAKDNNTMPDPRVGRIFAGSLELHPGLVDGSILTLRYTFLPAELTTVNLNGVPVLPEHLHDKMVKFAQAEALYKEREDALADRKKAEYEADLPARDLGLGRVTVKQRLEWEPGPFDAPGAAHLSG